MTITPTTDLDTNEVFTVANTFIFSTWLSAVLAIVTGTLMFTSEVQHGTRPPQSPPNPHDG